MNTALLLAVWIVASGSESPVPDEFRAARQELEPWAVHTRSWVTSQGRSVHDWGTDFSSSALAVGEGMLSFAGGLTENPGLPMDQTDLHGHYARHTGWGVVNLGLGHEFVRRRRLDPVLDYGTYPAQSPRAGDIYERKSLSIEFSDAETVSGDVDGLVNLNSRRGMVFAVRGAAARLRGFDYEENYSDPDGIAQIRYWDYHRNAGTSSVRASVGIRDRLLEIRRPALLSLVATWDYRKSYSQPWYIDAIRPYFSYANLELAPLVQFCGRDEQRSRFDVKMAYGDYLPDLVTMTRPFAFGVLGVQAVIECLSLTARAEFSGSRETIVNRWERNEAFYWGATGHTATESHWALITENSVRLYLFQAFFGRLAYSSNKALVLRGETIRVIGDVAATPEAGMKYLLFRRWLAEAGGSLVSFRPALIADLSGGEWSTEAFVDVRHRPQLFFRVALLGGFSR